MSIQQENKNKLFKEITEKIGDTLVRKNNDYGDSFKELFDEFGMNYAIAHMKEKINRIKQLSTSKAMVNESLEDSLMDLAGYAILTLATIKEEQVIVTQDEKKEVPPSISQWQKSVTVTNYAPEYTEGGENNRMTQNLKILYNIKDILSKFPDIRFGQALYATDVIDNKHNLFNEEPSETLKRVEKSTELLKTHKKEKNNQQNHANN